MSTFERHYDVIIIGTGAGGGTLAYRLAATGKKILVLERGDFLPRKANWNALEVYQRQHSSSSAGGVFQSQVAHRSQSDLDAVFSDQTPLS